LIKLIVKSDLCPGDLRVLEILVSFDMFYMHKLKHIYSSGSRL